MLLKNAGELYQVLLRNEIVEDTLKGYCLGGLDYFLQN